MKDRAAIQTLIDHWVVAENFGSQQSLDLKIALLLRVFEELKYERRVADDLVDFEAYTQCEVFGNTDKLFITAPRQFKLLGTGTARR